MRRIRQIATLLSVLVSMLLVMPSSAGTSGTSAGRLITVGNTSAQVLLVGDSYRVSQDGKDFGRLLPQQTQLKLRYATFDPLTDAGVLAVPEALAAKGAQAYIVQFVSQPLEAFHQEIASLGGQVYQYLPEQANIVLMNEGTRRRVVQLPYVRWVGVYQPAYKLDEALVSLVQGDGRSGAEHYSIMVLEKGPRMQQQVAGRIRALGGSIDLTIPQGSRLEATLTSAQLLQVAHFDQILFIDRASEPEDDMDIARQISGADFLQTTRGYTGRGVRGEVMDGGLRTTHQDFRARPPIMHNGNTTSTSHGTSTYGQIFGTGSGSATARGTLPDAQGIFAIYANNRYNHTAELVNPNGNYRAVFQSNSWGDALTTSYTTISAEMDDILFDHDILICQSQSNAGTRSSRPQAWAKNILSVGGIKHRNTLSRTDDNWTGGGSIGPASDGRIKPDVAHFYDSIRTTSSTSDSFYTDSFGGTSGATPITCGHAGLLFQMWADGVFDGGPGKNRDVFASRPHMTTAKALLINSAYQYSFSGTTHDLTRTHQGWGMVDLEHLYSSAQKHGWRLPVLVNEDAVLTPGQTHRYQVTVSGSTPLRATLVYADPQGSPSAAQHRINDLSLRVTAPNGTVYWGNNGLLEGNWSTAGGVSNKIDTVENVLIQSAASGTWTIEVLGDEIVQDSHVETSARDADYALVVSKDDGGSVTPTPITITPTPVTRTPTPITVTPTTGTVTPNPLVFQDDFETNKGWATNPNGSDTATIGQWERGDPEATDYNGPKQLGTTTSGSNDLVTGRLAGAAVGDYDLDGGVSSIRSPSIMLPSSGNLTLSLRYYLAHASNASSVDYLRVKIVGSTTTTVFERLGAASDVDAAWQTATINLNSYAGQTVQILIEAADASTGSLLEAAVDDVSITR